MLRWYFPLMFRLQVSTTLDTLHTFIINVFTAPTSRNTPHLGKHCSHPSYLWLPAGLWSHSSSWNGTMIVYHQSMNTWLAYSRLPRQLDHKRFFFLIAIVHRRKLALLVFGFNRHNLWRLKTTMFIYIRIYMFYMCTLLLYYKQEQNRAMLASKTKPVFTPRENLHNTLK